MENRKTKTIRISDNAYKLISMVKQKTGASYERIIDLAIENFKITREYSMLLLFGESKKVESTEE